MDGVLFVVLKALEKKKKNVINSTAMFLSRNNVVVTEDNPQTALPTVFIRNCFLPIRNNTEKCQRLSHLLAAEQLLGVQGYLSVCEDEGPNPSHLLPYS